MEQKMTKMNNLKTTVNEKINFKDGDYPSVPHPELSEQTLNRVEGDFDSNLSDVDKLSNDNFNRLVDYLMKTKQVSLLKNELRAGHYESEPRLQEALSARVQQKNKNKMRR